MVGGKKEERPRHDERERQRGLEEVQWSVEPSALSVSSPPNMWPGVASGDKKAVAARGRIDRMGSAPRAISGWSGVEPARAALLLRANEWLSRSRPRPLLVGVVRAPKRCAARPPPTPALAQLAGGLLVHPTMLLDL